MADTETRTIAERAVVRLPPNALEAIDAQAAQAGVSRSEALARAVFYALDDPSWSAESSPAVLRRGAPPKRQKELRMTG